MQAKDFMTNTVITATGSTDLATVTKIMVDNQIGGLPVVTEQGEIDGIITEGDLLRLYLPKQVQFLEQKLYLDESGSLEKAVTQAAMADTRDYMTREVISAEEDTSIGKIVGLMIDHAIKQVPIVRGGKLVGMVSRQDILRALAGRISSIRNA